MEKTIVGVDLAKKVIQVCVCTNKKVHSNTEMTLNQFTYWLSNLKPMTVFLKHVGYQITGSKRQAHLVMMRV